MNPLRIADCGLRIALLSLVAGCASGGSSAEPVALNPATTQPSYWYQQPSEFSVTSNDFDLLWHACEQAARERLFAIDRMDYREGVMTTDPMVSGQFLEPWRRDAQTLGDRAESSLISTRRTIRFEFEKVDAQWRVTPKIIVERQTIAERRLTSAVAYREAFARSRGNQRPRGSREADEGILLPGRYWYPLRRDAELERNVASDVGRIVRRGQNAASVNAGNARADAASLQDGSH
jgi:hypothetical protein